MMSVVRRAMMVVAAVISALAMCLAMGVTAQSAMAAAADDANVKQALEYMKQLNELRAKRRTGLTAAQIASANGVSSSMIAADTATGDPVPALKVNSDLMKWAQTRADELAAQGDINHDNEYNGAPSWAEKSKYNLGESPYYQSGTYMFGPEALAMGYPDYDSSHNPIDSWARELQTGEQGYGHYLTEVSKLADVAGMGVAKTSGGATITVLEIGYVGNNSGRGTTQTVEDALKQYETPEPAKYCSVSFDGNGNGGVSATRVQCGQAVERPEDPTRDGYTFDGWYTARTGGTLYDFSTPVTRDITLYAHWTLNTPEPSSTYTVKFHANGGSGSMPDQVVDRTTATPLNRNRFTRTGYSFKRWITSDSTEGWYGDGETLSNEPVSGDVLNLTAEWTAHTYTVKYAANGGSGTVPDKQTFTYDVAQNLAGSGSLGLHRDGYTPAGWNTRADGTGTHYDLGQSVSNLTAEDGATITLYVEWQADQSEYLTVKFHANGGEGTMPDQRVRRDTATQLNKNTFTRPGYTFSGWTTSDSNEGRYSDQETLLNEPVSGDVLNLYAQWTQQTYTVNFGGADNVPSQQVPGGSTATKPADPVKTGYQFQGWYQYVSYGSVYEYEPYDFNTPVTENIYVEALWKGDPRTVTYDANGGTGKMGVQRFEYNDRVQLKSNQFKNNGKTFIGWNTEPDGTGTSYMNDQLLGEPNSSVGYTGDSFTLYAQWTSATPVGVDTVEGETGKGWTWANYPSTATVRFSDGSSAQALAFWDPARIQKSGLDKLTWGQSMTFDKGEVSGYPQLDAKLHVTVKDLISPQDTVRGDTVAHQGDATFSITQGLYAYDDKDGDVTSRIQVDDDGGFDINVIGDYRLSYSVSDRAGNITNYITRTIHVVPASTKLVTVRFVPDDGQHAAYEQVFAKGVAQSLSTRYLSKDDYSMSGWNTKSDGSGESYAQYTSASFDSDTTLYAQWDITQLTLYFMSNDTRVNRYYSEQKRAGRNESITLLSTFGYSIKGYHLASWNTKSDGSGDSFALGQTVSDWYEKMTQEGVSSSLYAQWEPNSYTIQFKANDGSGTMASQQMTYDQPAALRKSMFTPPAGLSFTGWNTKADGTGTAYSPMQSVTSLAGSGTVTLYAQYGSVAITDIVVAAPPSKRQYTLNATPDYSGLTLTAKLSNGETRTLNKGEYTVSVPDMTTLGRKSIEVKLAHDQSIMTTFDIYVGTTAPTVATAANVANSSEAPMNYVVNLKKSATNDDLARAKQGARALDAYLLMGYDQLDSFFVQARTTTFGTDFAQWAARNNIPVDSVAPTRNDDEPLRADEVRSSDVASSEVASAAVWDSSGMADIPASDYNSDPKSDTDNAWGIGAVGADKAHSVNVPLRPTLVGVIDTGLYGNNQELSDQIDTSRSVSCVVNGVPEQGTDPATGRPLWWGDKKAFYADYGETHGTHVAGTIAAANNGEWVDGVSPTSKVASIKVLRENSTWTEQEVCGYMWAASAHMDVTNASLGNYTPDFPDSDPVAAASYEVLQRAVSYATGQGVVNVASAMNEDLDLDNLQPTQTYGLNRSREHHAPEFGPGTTSDSSSTPSSTFGLQSSNGIGLDVDTSLAAQSAGKGVVTPAMLDGVIAVSSVEKTKAYSNDHLIRSSFSNYGANSIDVAAPGSNIMSSCDGFSTWPVCVYSGTSMASPHVAGVAALLKAIHPDYSPSQITALLKKQARELYGQLEAPTDGKEYRGAGLANAYAAVTEDQPKATVGVQYSTDGGNTWKNLAGATITGVAKIRITMDGPLTWTGYTTGDSAGGQAFPGGLHEHAQYELDVDYSTLTDVSTKFVQITAKGRNQDSTFDDVNYTVNYTAGQKPTPPAPTYYTVSFDARGGSPTPQTQRVESGKTASQPTAPTRSGYTFDGWYTAATGGARYDFDATPVTSDFTLYAHWTKVPPAPKFATVRFDATGGSPVASQRVEVGKTASKPADPSRDGYMFDGWFTERTGGVEYDFSAPVNGDVTLYARWMKQEVEKGYLTRLSGAGRYDTMAQVVAREYPDGADTVVIATGEGYADALPASGLAGGLKAPIILSGHDGLSQGALAQIRRLKPSRAVLVGSTAVVPETVESQLKALGVDERQIYRAGGKGRYDTNREIYKLGVKLGVKWSNTLIIATGEGYADALATSSYAYKTASPILLSHPDTGLDSATLDMVRNQEFDWALIAGSETVVPARVRFSQLPSIGIPVSSSYRADGKGRYDTSKLVAEWCLDRGMSMDGAVFATGEGYADALSAGPLAGASNSALVLVHDPSSPTIAFAGEHADDVTHAWVVGSTAVVDQPTTQTIANTLKLKVRTR